jgi:hypothetical protein
MVVTIAVDDISLPLPPMARPDIRQTVLEIVCEMLADHGVDDVHIIVATSLHRRNARPRDPPDGRRQGVERVLGRTGSTTTTPAIRTAWVVLGRTRHGRDRRDQQARRRQRSRHLRQHQPGPDGRRHKSVGVGLCGYESLKAHHTPKAIVDPTRSWTRRRRAVALGRPHRPRVRRAHEGLPTSRRCSTTGCSPGRSTYLMKNEDDFTESGPAQVHAIKWALDKLPFAARREIFMRTPAAYELIACYAGSCEPTHASTLAKCYEQYAVEVEGQADILITGIPYISPYNVNSKALNPLPRAGDGARLLLSHVPDGSRSCATAAS